MWSHRLWKADLFLQIDFASYVELELQAQPCSIDLITWLNSLQLAPASYRSRPQDAWWWPLICGSRLNRNKLSDYFCISHTQHWLIITLHRQEWNIPGRIDYCGIGQWGAYALHHPVHWVPALHLRTLFGSEPCHWLPELQGNQILKTVASSVDHNFQTN